MQHFEYIANLVGIDHLAFGPDTLFGSTWRCITHSRDNGRSRPRMPADFEEVELVHGIENPAEASHNSTRWLVKHGYSDADIAKALGENVMRVLAEVWYC